MWLKYKTPNIHNDIRRKNPIAWIDLDSGQVFIIFVLSWIWFYFIIISHISFIWKLIILILLIILWKNLIKKFDDTKANVIHTEYWRTMLQWFRMYLNKITKWNIAIDKWNDSTYFKK